MLSTKIKIQLASIACSIVIWWRGLFGLKSTIFVVRNKIHWKINLLEGIDFSIWLLGGFEKNNLRAYERLVKSEDVVIDVGANIGSHTLPFAQLVGDNGLVVAVEPTNWAFEKLNVNLQLNPNLQKRVRPIQAYLKGSDAEVLKEQLYSSWPLGASTDLHSLHLGALKSTFGATGITLDDLVDRLGLTKIDFIKIDVDGHELSVLKGAVNALERFRPIIMMEMAPYVYENTIQFDELIKLLGYLKYKIYRLNEGKRLPDKAELIRKLIPKNGAINVILRSS